MQLRVLSWNLFHGRDFPPDPALRTWRSKVFRIDERNATHLQVNRGLLPEFAAVLAGADWDLALLQECPPRWATPLARATGAEAHLVLTSRNSLGAIRAALAAANPDLIASNEGGSNLTLVRPAAGPVAVRAQLELRREPERRAAVVTRLAAGAVVANLHTSTADALAESELLHAARESMALAEGDAVILGGDFNVRPDRSPVFAALVDLGFSSPGDGRAIDHVLARGLKVVDPPAPWPPSAREVSEDGLAIRLSDHSPVTATFTQG